MPISLLTSLRGRKYEVVLAFAVASYAVLFSYFTWQRYLALGASAYDLGNYNQALFTAVRSGRFFYYTSDLPANPGGSIFGAHFLPVFFLIVPFYAILPGIGTLLAMQSIVLSLGAIPLYFLSIKLTSRKNVGLLLAMLYLASPLIQGVNWLDFHPEAFIPLGFLTSLYAMEARRWKLYFAGIFLSLSSLEFVGVIVALYGAVEVFRHRSNLVRFLRTRTILEPGPIALMTIILSIIWTIVAISFIRVFNPSQTFLFGGNFGWSVLGARSLLTVPIVAFMNPQNTLLALSFDVYQKALFLILAFVPFFIFLKGGVRPMILTLPWAFVSVTSNLSAYYSFNDQYTVFLAPFLFAGAAYGYAKLQNRLSGLRTRFLFLNLGVVSSSILIALLLSPLVNVPLSSGVVFGNRGVPAVNSHDLLASELASMIPPDASVLTQPNLFPFVSNRPNAFLFPYQTYFPPGTTFNSTITSFIEQSQFILFDVRTDAQTPTWMLHNLSSWSHFGLYAAADGILLFKQGFVGSPFLFMPITETWTASSLVLQSGSVVTDTTSVLQEALYYPSSGGIGATFWKSPETVLPPGDYTANFRMRIDRPISDQVANLTVSARFLELQTSKLTDSQGGYNIMFQPVAGATVNISELTLVGGNFTSYGYQEYHLQFNLKANAFVNLLDTQAQGQYGLYIDQVTLVQLSP